ncbi:hypothetical protein A0J61_09419 [Choanephora cucurbitarum]|uniref:F-box domain-containing protein n=1 Tax=Choanephora cucurbitarum TaxID=101091 RepID=A0A1C7N0E8_9FUNG|nr:hypothetical protein A0J61_09419 [Choanephora cucurbitarum]
MIHLLPAEIIDCICTHLSQNDYYQLALVNQEFHDVFVASLYRDINLNLWRLVRFLSASRHSQHVKHITIDDSPKKIDCIKDFPIWFPSLNYLKLTVPEHPTSSPLPVFQHLSSLTLDIKSQSVSFLFDMLTAAPYLRQISILGTPHPMSVSILDDIHHACPRLEHLSIACDTLAEPSTVDLNRHLQSDKLKTFALNTINRITQYHVWLQYVASRYPNIEAFTLGSSCEVWTEERQGTIDAFDLLLSSCPHLVRLEWRNLSPDDLLFSRLSRHSERQQHITVSNTSLFEPYFRGGSLPHHLDYSAITRFEAMLPLVADDTSDIFIPLLGNMLPQLQELDLKINDWVQLSIETLLDLFPCLTWLQLNHAWVYVNLPENELRHFDLHPLKTLSLRGCSVSDDLFDYVAARCPHLEKVQLEIIRERDSPAMKICLPHHDLSEFRFSCNSLVRLFHVQRKQKSEWYFMDRYKQTGKYRHVTPVSFKKLNRSDVDMLNALLSQIRAVGSKSKHESAETIEPLPVYVFDSFETRDLIQRGYLEITCNSILSLDCFDKRLF